MAVKDNQKFLHDAITDYFDVAIAANNPVLCQLQCHEETHPGHGRIRDTAVLFIGLFGHFARYGTVERAKKHWYG